MKKGERVVIDDEQRISDGEFTDDIEKSDNYNDNITKFKDIECF